jgi:predicted dinucleotide-binding enzyme
MKVAIIRESTDQLGGAVVVDPTNPIDFGTVEMLDSAWIAPLASGGQLIAAEVLTPP